MLVLDTNDLPLGDRIDAYRTVAVEESGIDAVEEEEPEGTIWRRIELWDLGALTLFTCQGTGMHIARSLRQARRDAWDTVAVSIQVRGDGGFAYHDHQRRITPDSLSLLHMPDGYEYSWSGIGGTLAFMIEAERLTLPTDTVRASVPLLHHSPIGTLLLNHVHGLHRVADQLSGGPGIDALVNATTELTRAWIVSVAGDDRVRSRVAQETLLTRILAYARLHLREPDLTPQRIAWAHNMSVRTLYRLCEDSGLSLEQWIIRRRLEGTRNDLAAPAHQNRTIQSIARSWGFTNAAYFSRRFGHTFGTTPSRWRQISQF
ncbi:transcriptional regulator, AraC family [Streptomyces davaonensis JCM 4913]|uniref:Transcriptional regulator, AraC family n=1 Tax=Streptomyces davaonensis (strain DSM 101723 / JCM 4913 / KCC S-0913 / 768) TaxID=1214101 RepID=K4QUU1_STRDJ|nr:helix-turn-helix domain-containing protein [Streptomyces davaonensis]CCK24753.1 transcriptional regulator, AraC family [Streptomyces davaonensis JCM 4913]